MGKRGRREVPVVSSTENNFTTYVDGNNALGGCIRGGYIDNKINWLDPRERLFVYKRVFKLILKNKLLLNQGGGRILVVFDAIDGNFFEACGASRGVFFKMIVLKKGKADGLIKQLVRKGAIVVTADKELKWLTEEKKGVAGVIDPQRLFPNRYKKGKYRKDKRRKL
jgi:hypothetical protein